MNKIQLNIDASALKLSHCALKFYRTVYQGYRGKLRLNDIEFGSAIHKYISTFTQTKDQFKAMAASHEYWRAVEGSGLMLVKDKKQFMNIGHLTMVNTIWHLSSGRMMFDPGNVIQPLINPKDGLPVAELNFRLPYYEDEMFQIYLCGTIDNLGEHRTTHGLVITDYKSTSMWNVEEYLEAYALDPQLMFYVIALRRFAALNPDSVIAQKLESQPNVMARIQGIFIKPPSSNEQSSVVNSRLFQYSEFQLVEFEAMLKGMVMRLVSCIEKDLIPMREGMINATCEMKFGQCPFFSTCKIDKEEDRAKLLDKYFDRNPYDPLSFHELPKAK